jgi:uncharacterized protein (TIGR02246 family)
MKRQSSFFLTLALLILAGCSPSPSPDHQVGDARAIRDVEVPAFVKDWGGKDVGRIAAHFTDDGNLIIPNGPAMTGREAIAKGMKYALADPNWSLAMQPVQVDVSQSGDLAYVRGTYALTATDPASSKVATEKGRFIAIFRKQPDGSWKAVQQISNAEAPATVN